MLGSNVVYYKRKNKMLQKALETNFFVFVVTFLAIYLFQIPIAAHRLEHLITEVRIPIDTIQFLYKTFFPIFYTYRNNNAYTLKMDILYTL